MESEERLRLVASAVIIGTYIRHLCRRRSKKTRMRHSEGLYSRFPKRDFKNLPYSLVSLTVPLQEMPNCSPETTLIPSSLEQLAFVPINKNGKFPFAFLRSSSLCLVWLLQPFCFAIEVQPAQSTCKYPKHVITIYQLTG